MNLICQVPSCTDGHTNHGEADTDCGGGVCPNKCGSGQHCNAATDCTSGVCDMALHTCKAPACGDGITQVGETCDDANQDNTDDCTSACVAASCGDTFLHAGVEECDDGNQVNTDGCTSACNTAECGDGVLHIGAEECDDGNQVNTDACTNGCLNPTCSDGLLNQGENGVDCGGPCGSCPGISCAGDATCASLHCVDGLCCNTACSGLCQACSNVRTGGANGSCLPVMANSDPDEECAGALVCLSLIHI